MSYAAMKHRLFGTDTHKPCAWCGKVLGFVDATIDHLVPLAFGGRTNLSNVVIACVPCNRKRAKVTSRQVQEQVVSVRVPWRCEASPYGG